MTDKSNKKISEKAQRFIDCLLPGILQHDAVPEIKIPRYGAKSEVLLLHYQNKPGVALRVFSDKGRFARYAAAMQFCNGKGLPFPGLLHLTKNPLEAWRYGGRYAVEVLIAGETLMDVEWDESVRDAVLQSVVTMHNCTSSRWGRLHRLRSDSYLQYFKKHVDKLLDNLRLVPDSLLSEQAQLDLGKAVQELMASCEQSHSFSLVHHHLAPDDIIMSRDGAVILDNESLQFGVFVQDLEETLNFLSGGDQALREQLLGRYLELQTHSTIADYAEFSRPYIVEYHLKRLRRLLRKKSPDANRLSKELKTLQLYVEGG